MPQKGARQKILSNRTQQIFQFKVSFLPLIIKNICQSAMKRTLKLERPAHPISIAPRKHSVQQTSLSPRQKNWQSNILKQVDTNRAPNNTLVSTLQKEIKENISKTKGENHLVSEKTITSEMELQSLRDQVSFRRQAEDNLRREIIELKLKIQKNGEVTKDKYKLDRQKDIISERINKLQQELREVNQVSQAKEEVKNQRINILSKDLDKIQEQRNRLTTECARLLKMIKSAEEKQDQSTQYNQDEVLELREKMEEVEKQKIHLFMKLKEKDYQLKKNIQEFQSTIKEKDTKYNSCLNEFKKLESRLSRSKEDSLGILKLKIQQLQELLQTSKGTTEKLRCQNIQLTSKLERGKHQIDQQRQLNEDLLNKFRNFQTQSSNQHRNELNLFNKQIDDLKIELEAYRQKYDDKCKQVSIATQARSDSSIIQNQQVHKSKMKILSLEIQINSLNSEIQRYKQQLHSSIQLSKDKDFYIRELEKHKQLQKNRQAVSQMEIKYRQLYEQQERVVEEYQAKIIKLQKQMRRLQSKVIQKVQVKGQLLPKSFDQVLKQKITEIEQMKQSLNIKCEQIFQLKSEIEQWRRKAESIKSQTEIDKLKSISEQRTLKYHFQVTIQNLKNQLEIQQKKYDSLQKKVNFKTDELKRKDQFIQQVIIGKVGKPDNQHDEEYLRKELTKFFSVNYEIPLLSAQQRIQTLQALVQDAK